MSKFSSRGREIVRKLWPQWASRSVPPESSPLAYRFYTTHFDLEMRGDQLDKWLGSPDEQAFRDYLAAYDQALGAWRAAADVAAINSIGRLKAKIPPSAMAETVAGLLLDHSGSMRGQRIMIATALAEIVADYWDRSGIAYELLGFTTASWKGGKSRETWERGGRPANPGRLCDLLHIIYRSADQISPGAPWAIRNMMRLELLKENVDGEALAWAARRLRERPEPRKILLVVSDGVPVDDSTLLANEDPDILIRHLRETAAGIEADPNFRLGGIGIDHARVSDFYSKSIAVSAVDDLATRLIPFVESLFLDR